MPNSRHQVDAPCIIARRPFRIVDVRRFGNLRGARTTKLRNNNPHVARHRCLASKIVQFLLECQIQFRPLARREGVVIKICSRTSMPVVQASGQFERQSVRSENHADTMRAPRWKISTPMLRKLSSAFESVITLTRQCVEWLKVFENSSEMLRHNCHTIDGDTTELCRESNLAKLAKVGTTWRRGAGNTSEL